MPAMTTVDDHHNAKSLLAFIRSSGLTISTSIDADGIYHVHAADKDGQVYRLSGDRLYPLAVELAHQSAFLPID